MVAKLIIMLFPIFALIAYSNERFLELQTVTIFMLYMSVMSGLLVLYEIYSCTYGHHEEPSFLYQANDLTTHKHEVRQARQEYLDRPRQTPIW